MKPFDTYPGGKDASGVAERIVSLMPAHETYVELCVGGGAVFRKKRPAVRSVLVDLDEDVITAWSKEWDASPFAPWSDETEFIRADVTKLETWPASLVAAVLDPKTVVYCDPPYLKSTRTHGSIYRCELGEEVEHWRLLTVLRGLKCRVLLSGYRSKLYEDLLPDWRVESFGAGTRGGRRFEHVWMNFPEGLPLHDVRFSGEGWRERERIKKKRQRWIRMFLDMPSHEQAAILDGLREAYKGVL